MLWIFKILFAVVVTAGAFKALNFLQLGGYRLTALARYFKTSNFFLLFAASAACCVLYFAVSEIVALTVTCVLLVAVVFHERTEKKKTPIVFTKRVLRLLLAVLLINFGLCLVFAPMLPVCVPLVCGIAVIVLLPIEKAIGRYFLSKAKIKLKSIGATVVGITGSFAKTSVKNALASILQKKFCVFATPKSFNTPLGIARAINEADLSGVEIFVAELGARRKNDILELVKFVEPQHGIITGVAAAHLQTFKNLETIAREKFVLAKNLPVGGFCVFNADNMFSKKMCGDTQFQLTASLDDKNAFVFADGLCTAFDGCLFKLHIGGQSIDCKTKLLGRHNVLNVCLAAALAHKLGMSMQQIRDGIADIEPIAHRLCPINAASGLLILDDSFNANLDGIRASAEVLKDFGGKKAVIACGIVECGQQGYSLNKQVGAIFAEAADFVILVGRNSDAIKDGLLEKRFADEKIIFAKSLDNAVEIANSLVGAGDVLLFSNDLPDNLS